jgi:hypothetical protein
MDTKQKHCQTGPPLLSFAGFDRDSSKRFNKEKNSLTEDIVTKSTTILTDGA